MTRLFRTLGLATAASLMLASPASAQRDPAYQAARTQGLIGEQPDGYLGFVVPPTPEIRRMVEDLNIRRRAAYTERAAAANATVEQFAFTSGCRLIAETAPGERYRAPDGSWQTRTSAPPIRDSRCI